MTGVQSLTLLNHFSKIKFSEEAWHFFREGKILKSFEFCQVFEENYEFISQFPNFRMNIIMNIPHVGLPQQNNFPTE